MPTNHSIRVVSCALALALVGNPSQASAQGLSAPVPHTVLRQGTLRFTAHATVGDFTGSTQRVSGAVIGDVPDVRGWVEAPVASLETGNALRDRDLRGSMEVERYPTMRFDLASAALASPSATGDTTTVLLHGSLAIHGVSRAIDVTASIARRGDTIHVIAEFPLDLSDYRVGGLSKMFGLLRVRSTIEVHVDLLFAHGTNN
jgi:polyisoprenoid-binding protein YceI